MKIDDFPTEEKMIEGLENLGIRVRPILKAMVPQEMGLPTRNDTIIEEMDLYEAYRRFCLSPMLNRDPFSDNKAG